MREMMVCEVEKGRRSHEIHHEGAKGREMMMGEVEKVREEIEHLPNNIHGSDC